jgi:hypothetical protein
MTPSRKTRTAAEDDDAAPVDDEDAEETSDDPATQKRIDMVRKAEQRSRAKLAEERQALDADRTKHAERIARSRRVRGPPSAE